MIYHSISSFKNSGVVADYLNFIVVILGLRSVTVMWKVPARVALINQSLRLHGHAANGYPLIVSLVLHEVTMTTINASIRQVVNSTVLSRALLVVIRINLEDSDRKGMLTVLFLQPIARRSVSFVFILLMSWHRR